MERDARKYDTHYSGREMMELWDAEDVEVEFNVYGNNARFSVQFLNTKYNPEIRRIEPEVYTAERLDGGEEEFTAGEVRLELVGRGEGVIASRQGDVTEMGGTIKEGFGFIPHLNLETAILAERISAINIFIDVEEGS